MLSLGADHVATGASSAPHSHNTPKELQEAVVLGSIVASWRFNNLPPHHS